MPGNKHKKAAVPQVVRMEPLESRVLYSADLAPFLVVDDSAHHSLAAATDSEDWNALVEAESPLNNDNSALVTELVIVDSSQPDIEQLQQLLAAQIDQQNQVVLVTLDPETNALDSITEILLQYSNLDAVHIISHATEGAIKLGDQTVQQSDLLLNSELVKQWGSSFSEGGDLLLYGCNLSATDEGREFAKTLSNLTDTDVASSSDITGHALSGGNWDLEVSEGQIETPVIADAQVQDDWSGSLDITTGLIHHWALDGNGIDSVGGANLNYINGVGSPTGLINQAADFYETTSTIKWAEASSTNFPGFGTDDFSVALWMHVNTADAGTKMFGDHQPGFTGYSLTLDAAGRVVFTVENASNSQTVVSSSSVTDSDWRHVTAIRTGGTLELTIYNRATGDFETQTYNTGQPAVNLTANQQLRAGTSNLTNGDYEGLLDDIRIYDRVLSAEDAAQLVAMVVTGEFVVNNEGIGVTANVPSLVTEAELLTVSDGVAASDITYVVTDPNLAHQFYVNGNPVSVSGSFTQEDINNGLVTVQGNASTDSISLKVNDNTGASTDLEFAVFPALAVNTAPSVGSANFSVSEDDINPVGTTLDELIGPVFSDLDSVDSLAGILISDAVVDSTEGYWQYSTDNGAVWHNVGTASSLNALALSATTELRFLPALNYSGTPTNLVFHGVQTIGGSTTPTFAYTDGASRTEMPVTPNGGTTAISANTGFIDVTVSPVNDAPTLNLFSNFNFVSESQVLGTVVGGFNVSDADIGDTLSVEVIDALTGAVSTHVGVNGSNQLELIGNLDYETRDRIGLIIEVTDSTGLSDFATFTLNVIDANDPPLAIAPMLIPDIDEDDTNSPGHRIADIAGASYSDPDGGQELWGIAIVDHDSTAPSGHWEYQIGANWYNVGLASGTNALVLHKDTSIRFVPAPNYSGPASELNFHVIDDEYNTGSPASPAYVNDLFVTNPNSVSANFEVTNSSVLPINDAPDSLLVPLALSVDENAQNGQSVGTAVGSDIDDTDLVYSLVNDAGGRFAIDSLTGEVTVASDVDIDFEANSVHSIIIQVEDSANAALQKSFNVPVNDVNERPEFVAPVVLNAVSEDDTNPDGQTVAEIFTPVFSDVDSGDTLGGIAIVGNNASLAEGAWQFNDGAGWLDVQIVVSNSALVLSDSAQLRFVPATDYSGNPGALLVHAVDSVYFASNSSAAHVSSNLFDVTNTSVSTAGVVASLQVLPINDAPHGITTSIPLSVDEGAALGQSVGVVVGVDIDDTNFTYSLINNAGGRFAIDALTGEITLLSPADIDFEANSFHQILVEVDDPDFETFSQFFTVQVNDVNEQPLFTGPVSLTPIVEDSTNHAGETIADLFNASFADVDSGDVLGGIAIVQNNALASEGAWQYNDGAGWSDLGSVSTSNALVLSSTTQLRFVPALDFVGQVGSLTAHAIDNTYFASAANTATHYLSDLFATTNNSVSVSGVSINQVVTTENDPPYALNVSQPLALNEDALAGHSLGFVTGEDVDDTDLTYSLVTNAGGRFAIDALTGEVSLVLPSAIDHETNSFHQITVAVTDPSASVYQQSLIVQVGDVNERPSLLSNVAMNPVSEDVTAPVGQTVGDLFAPVFSDVDDGDTLGGVAIVGDNSSSSEGVWQFNEGAGWNAINTVSGSTALILTSDTLIRFLPTANYNGAAGELIVNALDSNYFSAAGTGVAHYNTNLFSAPSTSLSADSVAIAQQVLPVNDAPSSIFASSSKLVPENTPGVSITTIGATDVDDTSFTYSLANDAGGRFEIDALTGELRLVAGIQLDFEAQSTHPITVEVQDPSGATLARDYAVTVIDLPERPSLIANVTLSDQYEDDFSPLGESVSSLFDSVFSDQDIGDTLEGIIIVDNASDANIGRWQYQSTGGAWTDIGSVSYTNALVLAKGDELRFVPVGDYIGPVSALSVHAIDNTAGVPMTSHYSSTHFTAAGSPVSNAVSENAINLGGQVLMQNDSPTIAPLVSLSAISEDDSSPAGESIASLLNPSFTDIDAGQTLAGVAIVENSTAPSEGLWQYQVNGAGWQSIGTVSPTNALMLSASDDIRFVPSPDFNGPATGLSLFALDSTYAGAFSSAVVPVYISDLNTQAGSAVSVSNANVQTTVLPVDDLPTIQLQALDASVDENIDSSQAIDVASISVNDIDGGNHTLSLSGLNASDYQISGNVLQLKPGVVLDAETQSQLDVVVSVDESANGPGIEDSAAFSLAINNINEQPILTNLEANTLTLVENDNAVSVSNTIAISDADSSEISGAVVKFISGYEPSQDELIFTNQNGITGLFNAATGELSLQGVASVADYQTALQTVMYANSSENPSPMVKQLSFSVSDGALDSNVLSRELMVLPVNDAPELISNAGVNLLATDTVSISSAMLSSIDADHALADLTYTDMSGNSSIQWLLDGVPVSAFTQEDIDLGRVSLQASDAVVGTQALTLGLDDGESVTASYVFNVIVEPMPEPEPEPEPILGAALPEPVDVAVPEATSSISEAVFSFSESLAPAVAEALAPLPQTELPISTSQATEQASATQAIPTQVAASQEESEQASGKDSDLLSNAILSELNVPDFVKPRARGTDNALESDVSVEHRTIHRTVELSKIEMNELQLASILSLEPLRINEQSSFVNHEDNIAFNQGLEQLQEQLASSSESMNTGIVARDTVIGFSLSVTAGFLVWMLRGGALLASMFSISPLWKQLDPLPIVNGQSDNDDVDPDDDNVEAMFNERHSA